MRPAVQPVQPPRWRPPRTSRAGCARGLTLLELALAMAVLAILGALAVPSMATRLRAERLQAAAELYAADISDARHEAARRGQALHVEGRAAASPAPGAQPAWCWSVAVSAGCPCGDAGAAGTCRLKIVPANEHPGVSLVSSQPVVMQPDGQATPTLAAVFAAGDREMHVQVSRFGRARLCDPAGKSSRVPRC